MNYIQSYIHTRLTTILSPSNGPEDETDYEIDYKDNYSKTIHDRIISKRQASSTQSTPTRQSSRQSSFSPQSTSTPRRKFQPASPSPWTRDDEFETTIELPRDSEEYVDDTTKIREFVNIKQMLYSLRNLENLITQPNIEYEVFKKTYIESSYGLVNSINQQAIQQQQEHLQPPVHPNPTPKQPVNARDISRDELIIKIGLISVQIFVLLVDLFTPLFIQLVSIWRIVLGNEVVQKFLNIGVELIFVGMSLVLDYLKKYQMHKRLGPAKVESRRRRIRVSQEDSSVNSTSRNGGMR